MRVALLLLLLLVFELVSSMLDDTCFPAAAMTNYARPILWRNKTETERRCKVLCGDDPQCVAVSYVAPNCTHLGAADAMMRCSAPALEINVKKEGGCPTRTDITAGIDNPADKCVDFFPGKTKLGGQNGICPRDGTGYIVRGIDEFGNRVTLDNDINNKLTFNATRNLWKFFHPSSGYTLYFTSVSCATNTYVCSCNGLPEVKPSLMGGVGPKTETTGTCVDPTHRINFLGAKDPPGSLSVGYDAAEAVKMTITCKAGIWLLDYVNDSNGWQILNATCAP